MPPDRPWPRAVSTKSTKGGPSESIAHSALLKKDTTVLMSGKRPLHPQKEERRVLRNEDFRKEKADDENKMSDVFYAKGMATVTDR